MGWASAYIQKLKAGETVQFRPKGNSMSGRIEPGQLVTVAPVKDPREIGVGSIVLCKIHGREFLHLVKAIRHQQWQIGNNKGHINGWVGVNGIFGRCISVEP
jgi:hypothetical protein